MTNLITRFAPSPTGNLHIGSARTALINFIVSSQNKNSKFYIRIEDTDKSRSKNEFKINILNGLKWLGLKWDNEPQIQSQNIKRHLQIANELLKNNFAYKCACSEEKLEKKRRSISSGKTISKKICTECKDNVDVQSLDKNYVIRIKIPEDGNQILHDLIQGEVKVKNNEIDDYVIIRKNNTPTYMLSVVVDDHDLGVNFIIRGDDHLNNYFRQKFIYEYMDWEIPKYAHLPLIHGDDGLKLSKRHGSINLIDLKEQGYLPNAIINNLILLGWAPSNQKDEKIDLSDIIKEFNIKNLSKSSSIFNYTKLNFFNNYYLKKDENLNLFINYCKNNTILKKFYELNYEKLILVFNIYKKEISKYDEMLSISKIYFDDNFSIDISKRFEKEFDDIYYDFLKLIIDNNNWEHENLSLTIKDFLNRKKIKFPVLGKPVRYLLTNSLNGPSITDIFMILGKQQSINRLKKYNF